MDRIVETARRSYSNGNLEFAWDCYIDYLSHHVDDVEIRMEFRQKQRSVKMIAAQKGKLIDRSLRASHKVKVFSQLCGKKEEELLVCCEHELCRNPFDIAVLRRMAEAFQRIQFLEAAIFVGQDVCDLLKNRPEQRESLEQLAKTYSLAGMFEEAQKTLIYLDKWFGIDNADEESRQLFAKTLPAKIHIRNMEKAGSYRDVIKDSVVAHELEKADVRTSVGGCDEEGIRELKEALKNDDLDAIERTSIVRRIAECYYREKAFDQAIQFLQENREDDSTHEVQKRCAEMIRAKYDDQLATLQGEAKKGSSADLIRQIERLEYEKWKVVTEEYEKLIAAIPTSEPDLNLALGEGYFQLGRLNGNRELLLSAVREFQRSYVSDDDNYFADLCLGKCYHILGWHKLAIEHLEGVLEWSKTKTFGLKRTLDVAYELANVCREIRDTDGEYKALAYIIQQQIEFRDTAERFEMLNSLVVNKL